MNHWRDKARASLVPLLVIAVIVSVWIAAWAKEMDDLAARGMPALPAVHVAEAP